MFSLVESCSVSRPSTALRKLDSSSRSALFFVSFASRVGSPACSSEIVVMSVALGYVTSADSKSPPPNGYTTVVGRSAGRLSAKNFDAGSR